MDFVKKKIIKKNCVQNGWRESKRLEGKRGGGSFCDKFGDGDGRFQSDI